VNKSEELSRITEKQENSLEISTLQTKHPVNKLAEHIYKSSKQ